MLQNVSLWVFGSRETDSRSHYTGQYNRGQLLSLATENFKCVAGKVLVCVCVCVCVCVRERERENLSFTFSGLITAFTLSLLQTPQRQHTSEQLPDNSTYWARESMCTFCLFLCPEEMPQDIRTHILIIIPERAHHVCCHNVWSEEETDMKRDHTEKKRKHHFHVIVLRTTFAKMYHGKHFPTKYHT